MTSSSTTSTPLSVLVSHGSTLAALQRKGMILKNGATFKETQERIIIDPMKVVSDIRQIVEEFKKAKHLGQIVERGVSKVLHKIEGILQQLIRDDEDNDTHYKVLVEEIEEYLNELLILQKRPYHTMDAATASLSSVDDTPLWDQIYQTQSEEHDPKAAMSRYTTEEKDCLHFCHSFFNIFDSSLKIKKRELIHWWIGLELIDDSLQGERLLERLVAEEFLRSPTENSRYIMRPDTRVTFTVFSHNVAQKDRLVVASNAYFNTPRIVAAINMSACTLNAKIFDWLFQMRTIQVIHLGSWHPGMDYIVVEDMIIKNLHSFNNLKEVRFLSFQGVSRLLELPSSVYSLVKLKVLDLRACQDLRSLPKGIESLQQLIYLDLSHCYELSNIPTGITALSELRVLKGFVIDSEDSNRRVVLRKHRSSSCPFNQLSKLKKLTKLSITTRMMNFPRNDDAETLRDMLELTKLRITWVHTTTSNSNNQSLKPQSDGDGIQVFPTTLQKLELQAAPETTASRLLRQVSYGHQNLLEKLYIKGGGPEKLDPQECNFPSVKVVRFRYLSELHMEWDDFKMVFPKITRFEIFACPHLTSCPLDKNGVWEES